MDGAAPEINVTVPQLGEAVARAQIGRWIVENGAHVEQGDLLLELETDKVSLEIVAPTAGVIEVLEREGAELEPDALLARIAPSKSVSGTSELNRETIKESQETAGVSPSDTTEIEEISVTDADNEPTSKEYAPVHITRTDNPNERRQKLSPLRRAVAHNLKTTQNTAAILSTFNEIDMSAVKIARSRLKERFARRNEGAKLGFTSFFARAVTVALQDFPILNAYLDGDEIVWRRQTDLGIAIGAPQGLVVPVLRNANAMGFGRIEHQIADFAERAKSRKLTREDLTGATFTITNGGVFGSMLSTPLLGPKQTGVLGLHSIKDRAVVENGEIVVRPIMYAALSYDHRLLDGKDAVRFLARIKELIEDPVLLMVDHI